MDVRASDAAGKDLDLDIVSAAPAEMNVSGYGDLIATYEGKIDIDNNENGSVMFDLDGKRYVYYNAIIEVIEK